MNWSVTPFESLYNSIENNEINYELFEKLVNDLQNLNLKDNKIKNQTSRTEVEKGIITLDDGSQYKLSQEFIISVIKLSDELNLDEIVVCHLMLSNLSDEDYSKNDNLLLINNGKVQYYMRRQYILQIISYIVNCLDSDNEFYAKLIAKNSANKLIKNLLPAFKSVHLELEEIKNMVNKEQILDHYNLLSKQNVKFRRDCLLKEYDILSQILYGVIDHNSMLTKQYTLEIMDQVSDLPSDDYFIVYYIPALFNAFSKLNDYKEDNDILSLHKEFLNDLKNDSQIFTKPIRVTLIFVFLTFFISWCKQKPNERAKSIDFKSAIDEPMTLSVELGAIEQLLTLVADTSIVGRDKSIDLFYDIRSLLQRHIPRLVPKILLDDANSYDKIGINSNITNKNSNLMMNFSGNSANNFISEGQPITGSRSNPTRKSVNGQSSSTQFLNIKLSESTEALFISSTHIVLQKIISDCAFLLTKIKDAEEDSLLSGEDLDLNDISVKADLERFFLTIYFFYASRPQYSKAFWEDKESSAYGFIEWSAKCTDILMRSCFYLMISSLSYGNDNSVNVFHYFGDHNVVSWNIIAQCLKDYIVKINNYNTTIQQKHQTLENTEINSISMALEEGLNEETIIFISSLLTLVSSVAYDVEEKIKSSLSNVFTDVLFEFSKLETPLIGACLKSLSNLVPHDTIGKQKFWLSLDAMIFKTATLTSTSDSYKGAFYSIFTNFTEILGFLNLFNNLVQLNPENMDDEFLKFGKLEYPTGLGKGYRKLGMYPYFDYILNDILVSSAKIDDQESRMAIQIPILEIIDTSLRSFDYRVMINSVPAGADLNKLVDTTDFFTYVKENPTPIVFNFLLKEKVYQTIFNIVEIGVDELSRNLDQYSKQKILVQTTLLIINRMLESQEPCLEELLPIVKKQLNESYVIPKDFGFHSLRSFYDAIFFNLSIIVHFGLYVGIDDYKISCTSISILSKIASQYSVTSSQEITENKILTMFDAVDESARIKDAFISQLECPIDNEDKLMIKLDILNFLNENLSYSDKSITLAHFLLGFQVSDILSAGPHLSTFLNSDYSLFKSLLFLLQSSLEAIDAANIKYDRMRLAAVTMELLLKLCRNPATSNIIFSYLLEYNFFEMIIELDPQITKYTMWEGHVYEFSSTKEVELFVSGPQIGALLSFFSYRNHLIQYLGLFIHRVSFIGTNSQITSYVSTLISNTMYTAKIFSYLDTTSYNSIPFDKNILNSILLISGLPLDLNQIQLSNKCNTNIYDFENINTLFRLFKNAHHPQETTALSFDIQNGEKSTMEMDIDREISTAELYLSNNLSEMKFSKLQLSTLHSWVQLVQILVSDGNLSTTDRSIFILEIFSTIVPKINDYVEFDTKFSEQLVSLAVFLYEIYNRNETLFSRQGTLDTRLFNLFKVCIHGITSPLSSVSLRSDFYTLANQYLTRIINDNNLAKDVLQNLRIQSEKFIDTICNDAVYGESGSRITAILLLDSLVQIANWNKESIILDSLVKNGHLLSIIRTLKNVDRLINFKTERITIDGLLYEITAFKTTIFFLIRIAETRYGAQALVNNKLLQVLNGCSFLRLDPELGINVIADDIYGQSNNVIKITLDDTTNGINDLNNLSLFELITPAFKLCCVILISAGNQNTEVIKSVKNLLAYSRKLLIGVFKRDALQEMENVTDKKTSTNLQELSKLIGLLCTVTGYYGEEIATRRR